MPEAQLGPFNGTGTRLTSPQMSELDNLSLSVTLLSPADKGVDRYEHHRSVCVCFFVVVFASATIFYIDLKDKLLRFLWSEITTL